MVASNTNQMAAIFLLKEPTPSNANQMAAIFLARDIPPSQAFQMAAIFSVSPGRAYPHAPLKMGNHGPLVTYDDWPILGKGDK